LFVPSDSDAIAGVGNMLHREFAAGAAPNILRAGVSDNDCVSIASLIYLVFSRRGFVLFGRSLVLSRRGLDWVGRRLRRTDSIRLSDLSSNPICKIYGALSVGEASRLNRRGAIVASLGDRISAVRLPYCSRYRRRYLLVY
jgi:hypothetical protein